MTNDCFLEAVPRGTLVTGVAMRSCSVGRVVEAKRWSAILFLAWFLVLGLVACHGTPPPNPAPNAPNLFLIQDTDQPVFVPDDAPYAELRVTPDPHG